ncbi:hypothetical protein RJ639_023528 [Escallonia herrerae]|uniref:Uncharacterized protein n=1 Tax=Escallonia herrerae TaxID=1293975 RepID=A0AA89AFI8_9ASTE|nr:hypothetical protein RJ639_023528 [Escallonia herrerae]
MEIETSQPMVAQKLWNLLKTMFYMLRKGISKSKLLVDLHTMLKRGKIASKAIANLLIYHQYAAFSCRANEMSFVSPGEYEFSCSNSPAYLSFFSKHKSHHQPQDINVAKQVLEMLSNYDKVEASPVTLPGFGRTPRVRQLRVTDSPFPVKDAEEDAQVDKAAEDFIKRFYKQLKQQKRTAALESPSPYHMWAR